MTTEQKYKELKKGFNKVIAKRSKWKNKFHNERRRRRMAQRFIALINEGLREDVSKQTLQLLVDDYYDADQKITTMVRYYNEHLNKIQNEYRRNLNGKRKRTK